MPAKTKIEITKVLAEISISPRDGVSPESKLVFYWREDQEEREPVTIEPPSKEKKSQAYHALFLLFITGWLQRELLNVRPSAEEKIPVFVSVKPSPGASLHGLHRSLSGLGSKNHSTSFEKIRNLDLERLVKEIPVWLDPFKDFRTGDSKEHKEHRGWLGVLLAFRCSIRIKPPSDPPGELATWDPTVVKGGLDGISVRVRGSKQDQTEQVLCEVWKFMSFLETKFWPKLYLEPSLQALFEGRGGSEPISEGQGGNDTTAVVNLDEDLEEEGNNPTSGQDQLVAGIESESISDEQPNRKELDSVVDLRQPQESLETPTASLQLGARLRDADPSFDEDILRQLVAHQSRRLDDYDQDDKWSLFNQRDWIPLDAEVEVYLVDKPRKRRSLDKAFADYAKRKMVILVGEAGAGKSVAVRNFCRERLLRCRSVESEDVPIYINFREWSLSEEWTEAPKLPDDEVIADCLEQFIVRQMSSGLSSEFRDELQKRVRSLLYYDRLLLVFDSFDEIPTVVDGEALGALNNSRDDRVSVHNSWLKSIARGISILVHRQQRWNSIIATRGYGLTHFSHDAVVCRIRPFSEPQVRDYLRRSTGRSTVALNRLFRRHKSLTDRAQNPLIAALCANFLRSSPSVNLESVGERELFECFLESRVAREARMGRQGELLSVEDLREVLISLAKVMFSAGNFLVVERDFPDDLKDEQGRRSLEELNRIGFLRTGQKPERGWYFTHRRFAEYFGLQPFLESRETPPFENLERDARWKEIVILYCRIGPGEGSAEIAEYAYARVREYHEGRNRVRTESRQLATSWLSILVDGFAHAPWLLSDGTRSALATMIESEVKTEAFSLNGRPRTTLYDVEWTEELIKAVPLLPAGTISRILNLAMDWQSGVLRERIIRASRYAEIETSSLDVAITRSIGNERLIETIRKRKETAFLIEISDGLKCSRVIHKLRVTEFVTAIVSVIALLVAAVVILPFLFGNKSDPNENDIVFAMLGSFLVLRNWYLILNHKNTVWPLKGLGIDWGRFYGCILLLWLGGRWIEEFSGYLILAGWITMCIGSLPLTPFVIPLYAPRRVDGMKRNIKSSGLNSFVVGCFKKCLRIVVILGLFVALIYYSVKLADVLRVVFAKIGWTMEEDSLKHQFLFFVAITIVFLSGCLLFIGCGCVFHRGFRKVWTNEIQGFVSDWRSRHEVAVDREMSREAISEIFCSRKSGWGRKRVVVALKKTVKRTAGNWPNGSVPFLKNDPASRQLKELDRKWREFS